VSSLYPRVLLVNVQPISRRFAAGIVMGNLFRGWPPDRIAQVYRDDSEPDTTVCPCSWRLKVEDVPMPRWLQRQAAKQKRAPEAQPRVAVPGGMQRPQTRPRSWTYGVAKTVFLRYAKYAPYSIPPAICREVTAFEPDVIYSILESRRITHVALDFAQRLSLPLVPHFMDDWMATPASPHSRLLEKWARRDLTLKTLRLLRDAPVRLTISEYMAAAYERRYGYEFLPFSNCIDLEQLPAIRAGTEGRRTLRIGFAGRLHLGRADALVDVVAAMEALSTEGIETELVLYRHDANDALPNRILQSPQVRFADAREEALLETSGREVDAFLHVDTFEEVAGRYSRYSVSAKLPWYLAAGVPLFAYGAEYLGSIRFLREQQCAVVVDRRDPRLLSGRLKEFVQDGAARRALGERGRLVAHEHFDASVQKEAFRQALVQASQKR
jgi:glycosyltransferase involved in cell wall biosynthesis